MKHTSLIGRLAAVVFGFASALYGETRNTLNAIRLSVATGIPLGALLLLPNSASAQSSGIGSVVQNATNNNAIPIVEAFKLALAAAGVVAVGYGIFGLTWGRNGENARDYGVMKMLGFMLGGAVATSLGLLTSTWSATMWGSDSSQTSDFNLQ